MGVEMTGQDFERYCAEVLRSQGFRHVELTKGSGDQGADILAEKGGLSYAVQCKYYARPVGNKAVQEAFSAQAYYDCDVAMVMTNTTFTAGARELAASTGVELREGIEPERAGHLRFGCLFAVLLVFAGAIAFLVLRSRGNLSPASVAVGAAVCVAVALLLTLLYRFFRWRAHRRYLKGLQGYASEEEYLDYMEETEQGEENSAGEELLAMAEEYFPAGCYAQHFKRETLSEEEYDRDVYVYQIVGTALHSETREPLMIYRALYDDGGLYARPLSMFLSRVDREKYPEIRQEYRFQRIDGYR